MLNRRGGNIKILNILGTIDFFACVLCLIFGPTDIALVLAVLYMGLTVDEWHWQAK